MMEDHTSHDKALDDLERDAERDRAALASTVEALRGRLDTGANGLSGMIADRARSYVSDRRSAAINGVLQRIEDHPLQTVAMAAMVAYPVVRIVTKIPAPVLLLGAGVALAGRGGSGRSDASGSDEYAKRKIALVGGARMPPVQENGLREPLVSVSTNSPARAGTSSPSPSGTEASLGRTRADALSQVRQRASEAGRAGGETLVAAIRRNPAIAGGISLAVGAALAAMLPRTRVEGQAFGEAAEDIRERARSLAAEGIETGRRAVEAAVEAGADAAEEQDLTGEGARTAIRDGADRVDEAMRDAAGEAKDVIKESAGS